MPLKKNPGSKLKFARNGGEPPIPPEFVAAMDRGEEVQAVANDVAPESLSDTIVESKVETDRKDERVRRTVKKKPGNITLVEAATNQQGQAVTVTRVMKPEATAAAPTALKDVTVKNLGNGWQIETAEEKGSVLALARYVTEKRRILPEIFYVGVTDITVELTTTGTAAQPTLTGTQIRGEQQQLDAFNKRTSTTTGGTVANGTSFTGKEHISDFGGAIVDNVQSTATSSTLSVDFRTVHSQSTPNGDGTFLVTEQKLPSGNWPVLTETEWDDFAQKLLVTTKQFVAAGTVTSSLTAGVLTTEKQYDDLHTLKMITQYVSGTVPAEQVIPVSVEVSVPEWFTRGPNQVDASSGYAVDRGADYDTKSKNGKFAGTLTRTFSNTIPAAPSGTYLKFEVLSVHASEAYSVSGTDMYAKILSYDVPQHVAAEPTGSFIVGVQVQQHRHVWVLEVLSVTL